MNEDEGATSRKAGGMDGKTKEARGDEGAAEEAGNDKDTMRKKKRSHTLTQTGWKGLKKRAKMW